MGETPLEAQKSVELVECGTRGVREAKVLEANTLPIEFDRFMRLSTTAEEIHKLNLSKDTIILDVGGFDGAFALFVPNLRVWVIDPQTTEGNGLNIPFPDRHFKVVISIDALEHVQRTNRQQLLQELVRVTRSKLLVNFPEARSMEAQKKVLSIIDNRFIREHVEYRLPTHDETITTLKEIQPTLRVTTHSYVNINTWMAWFILFHTNKENGLKVSNFLKEHTHKSDPPFLYDLLTCDIEQNKEETRLKQ